MADDEHHDSYWHRVELFLDELDLTPKVTIPKELHVDNPRLVMLNMVLLLSSIGGLTWFYIAKQPHLKEVPYMTSAELHVKIDSIKDAGNWAMVADHEFCSTRQHVSCIPMCTPRRSQNKCQPTLESIDQISAKSLFVPVSTRLESSNPNVSVGPAGSTPNVMYFVESFQFALTYTARPASGTNLHLPAEAREASSENSAATIVVDSKEQVWKVFAPGQEIMFGFKDLPQLTRGIRRSASASFLEFMDLVSSNGSMVTASVDCYNNLPDAEAQCHGLEASTISNMHAQVFCLARFRTPNLPPSATQRFYPHDRNSTGSDDEARIFAKVVAGVYLQGDIGSGFGRWHDVEFALLTLTTVLVILDLPNKLLRIFVMVCMGHLSRIYRRGIRERFQLEQQIGELAAELVSHKVTFDALAEESILAEEPPSPSPKASMISFDTMSKHLSQVLTQCERKLDPVEIQNLLQFAMVSLNHEAYTLNRRSSRRHGVRQELSTSVLRRSLRKQHSSRTIDTSERPMDLDQFMLCVSGRNRILDLDHAAGLFKKTRYKTKLEQLFTPARLSKALHLSMPRSNSKDSLRSSSKDSNGSENSVVEPEPIDVEGNKMGGGDEIESGQISCISLDSKLQNDRIGGDCPSDNEAEHVSDTFDNRSLLRLEEQSKRVVQLELALETLAKKQETEQSERMVQLELAFEALAKKQETQALELAAALRVPRGADVGGRPDGKSSCTVVEADASRTAGSVVEEKCADSDVGARPKGKNGYTVVGADTSWTAGNVAEEECADSVVNKLAATDRLATEQAITSWLENCEAMLAREVNVISQKHHQALAKVQEDLKELKINQDGLGRSLERCQLSLDLLATEPPAAEFPTALSDSNHDNNPPSSLEVRNGMDLVRPAAGFPPTLSDRKHGNMSAFSLEGQNAVNPRRAHSSNLRSLSWMPSSDPKSSNSSRAAHLFPRHELASTLVTEDAIP